MKKYYICFEFEGGRGNAVMNLEKLTIDSIEEQRKKISKEIEKECVISFITELEG